jgi:hypothetical protein
VAEEEWLAFAAAAQVLRQRLSVTISEAEVLLRSKAARGELRAARDSELAANIASRASPLRRPDLPASEPGSALNLLGEGARQLYVNAVLAERPLISRLDFMKLVDQAAQDAPASTKAPIAKIEDVITAVYDDAERDGLPPPNINDLPKAVLPRLKALGFVTSGNQIKKLGRAERFARRRGLVGKRRS